MTSKITISIPEPCHENWRAMTVVEKGRFCGSCQKNVIDFTTSSDRQIIETFNKTNHLCGRFTTSQLNRELVVPKEKNTLWLVASAAIIGFLGLGSQTISAQEKTTTEQTDKKSISEESNNSSNEEEREITGIVSDSSGVLSGANVIIKGTQIGTQTDIDGKFSIKANENDILVFSLLGFFNKELMVDKSNSYYVQLQNDYITSLSGQVGGAMLCKRKTIIGRITYKIHNWFR